MGFNGVLLNLNLYWGRRRKQSLRDFAYMLKRGSPEKKSAMSIAVGNARISLDEVLKKDRASR